MCKQTNNNNNNKNHTNTNTEHFLKERKDAHFNDILINLMIIVVILADKDLNISCVRYKNLFK